MGRLLDLTTAAAFVLLSGSAHADQCSDALTAGNGGITPSTLAAVLNVLPKGEYETSADYQTRIQKLVPNGRVVVSVSISNSAATYNADQGRLVFDGATLPISDQIILDHVALAYFEGISIKDVTAKHGSYIGQNAFGTKARVYRDTMKSIGIAWKNSPTKNFNPIGQIAIPMSAASAKTERNRLRLLLIGNLSAPYVVQDSDVSLATVSDPLNFEHEKKSLVVDPVCAAIYDPAAHSVALASWDAVTRQ